MGTRWDVQRPDPGYRARFVGKKHFMHASRRPESQARSMLTGNPLRLHPRPAATRMTPWGRRRRQAIPVTPEGQDQARRQAQEQVAEAAAVAAA